MYVSTNFQWELQDGDLGDCVAAQKPFVCLKEAPKQTLCSLLTLDFRVKTRCTIAGTSVADTRKGRQEP